MSLPSRSFVRAYNRYNILNTIRTSDRISRIDLSKQTGISQATVTAITSHLIKEGLIVEKEAGAYAGGRPPVLLAINPNGAHVLGVNVELNQISVAIINFQAQLKAFHTEPLENDRYSPEGLADKIMHAIQACIWESGFSKEQISGVGIGLPGLVDSEKGLIRFMPNYGWVDLNFRDLLKKKIKHNVFIDNDANNLTIAEHWFGKGRESKNFIVIALESGVGAGCVVNGQLMRGFSGMASEFGHLIIDSNGPICKCGKRGCIGTYVGIVGILRDVAALIESGKWQTAGNKPLSFDDVLSGIKDRQQEILQIYDKAGRVLGTGISHLMKLFDPEKIIITGSGVLGGDALFTPMFESIKESQPDWLKGLSVEIVINSWADENWAIGAGTLALQEIYKSPAKK